MTQESCFERLDERFDVCVKGSARVERLAGGCRWAEGAAWFPAGRYVIWSDIPNDRMMKWDETSGETSVFRQPAGYTNGNTVDRQGRLVSCQHGYRSVTRTEFEGSVTTLADRYDGKRLNSPNDLVVSSDGAIWFTDPAYGIDSDYEGHKAASELDGCHVYRIDPTRSAVTRVADDFVRPNGIAFSPDESKLYITDTGHPDRHCRVFDVDLASGKLSGDRVWAEATNGGFDGFRFDTEGRCWMSGADGVHCLDPDGTLLGKVLIPEPVANLVFGGLKRNRMFICGTTSLYSVMLTVNGVKTF
ncbi:MAG: SMP-30/gluconolactonase/LRE family protein [Chloroflexia bacterium]|nr:SMP-30/gluconolactonase/LRE family protein [Chloroflexia bacterium]